MSTWPPSGDDEQLLSLARAIADADHPLKTETAAWAEANLAGHDRVAADVGSSFAADDWRRCAARGILGLTVPAEYGGSDGDLATTLLTLEGLGYGCRDNGLAFAIASQMLSTQIALVRFGSPELQQRWLPRLVDGTALGAFAMTEVETGSDAFAISATADRLDDGSYRLNGEKAYITLGSRCDVIVAFASTNPGAGSWGLSAFVVPTDTSGVERLPNREKMGMRTTPFGNVAFRDAVVPADALLGREGAGASIFTAILEVERSFVFATQVGAMERWLDDAVRYANEREQGGQPIGKYQAVSHRIADMKQHHESARLFLYRAALAFATGRHVSLAAAMAKLTASEAGVDSALAAASVFGARGYVSEYEVERDVRDAVGGLVYSGTSDIQRNIIARLLGIG